MKPEPITTDQAPALTPGGPVVYCFSFRMRAGGELKEIMQAATMLERPITVTSLKLSVNMDSLASDLIKILDWYDVQIYAGRLLRFNAPLYCIPIQGLHVPEAIRPAPSPAEGMAFHAGEAIRLLLNHHPDETTRRPPSLLPRDATGSGVALDVVLQGKTK